VLHQFRNPLTAVRTFGKLLLKRLQPKDRNRAVAESIVRESDRLQDLLQQLSAAASFTIPSLPSERPQIQPSEHPGVSPTAPFLSDYPSDQRMVDVVASSSDPSPQFSADPVKALIGHTLQLRPQSLTAILQPLLLSAQAIAQDRGIELQYGAAPHLPHILADESAVREILNNLIDNALKYTPTGGQVTIITGLQSFIAQASPALGTAILDSGPGIPEEDQPYLFQRHFRGVQAEGSIPGTGLGLAIAQQIVQQMQGHIDIFSPIHRCPPHMLDAITSIQTPSPPDNSANDDENAYRHSGLDPTQGTLFIVWIPVALNSAIAPS